MTIDACSRVQTEPTRSGHAFKRAGRKTQLLKNRRRTSKRDDDDDDDDDARASVVVSTKDLQTFWRVTSLFTHTKNQKPLHPQRATEQTHHPAQFNVRFGSVRFGSVRFGSVRSATRGTERARLCSRARVVSVRFVGRGVSWRGFVSQRRSDRPRRNHE